MTDIRPFTRAQQAAIDAVEARPTAFNSLVDTAREVFQSFQDDRTYFTQFTDDEGLSYNSITGGQ